MDNIKNLKRIKNTNGHIENKPLNKVNAAPPVRQTLTSYKRMLQANPLLRYQAAGIDVDQMLNGKLEGTSLKEPSRLAAINPQTSSTLENKGINEFKEPDMRLLKRTQSLKLPRSAIISGNGPLTNNFRRKPLVNNSESSNSNSNSTKPQAEPKHTSSNKIESKKPIDTKPKLYPFLKRSASLKIKSVTNTNKGDLKTENENYGPKHQTKKAVSILRRSLSSESIERKSNKSKPDNSHIKENLSVHRSANFPPAISPILEANGVSKNFVFKSPSAYARRSIGGSTPYSGKKTMIQSSTPAPIELERLHEKLDHWLKSKGKLLCSFQYLRHFSVKNCLKTAFPELIDEENKENFKSTKENIESLENPKIINTQNLKKENTTNECDSTEEELPKVAKKAMVELQILIQEDFPRAQCLGWLELIREKYRKADEEPEYWECKAAIEQSIGNVGNAVEFYKTAIIQGAEVTTVDRSLDQLLKKFSLLNISPEKSKQKKGCNDKERIFREARNVFKSTIIQFAVQERNLRKVVNDECTSADKLSTTPVRRTSRLSGSRLSTSFQDNYTTYEKIND